MQLPGQAEGHSPKRSKSRNRTRGKGAEGVRQEQRRQPGRGGHHGAGTEETRANLKKASGDELRIVGRGSQAQLEAKGNAALQDVELERCHAELSLYGDPSLRAGVSVELGKTSARRRAST